MWNLIDSKVKPLTKALAQAFVGMDPAPNDRPLSDRRIQVYRKQVTDGLWRPCDWAKAICEETGITYRVNGKHTSTMFAGMDEIPPDLYVVVHAYGCPTLFDVAQLYATFDSAMASRTHADINRAFAAVVPELARLLQRLINACAAGIQLYKCGGDKSASMRLPPALRAENLITEAQFVMWVAAVVLDTNKFAWLARAGVVAAMFATWKKAQRDATLFWVAVRDETGSAPQAPDRVISKYLQLTKVHPGDGARMPKSRQADAREMFARSLHCWNAWRRSEPVKQLKYYSSQKLPVTA